ncbi:MAG: hypothetical protein KGH75_05875 [Rhodospirillales bacterium]|nr:hypothetical protein [Rhodospirillales bacterium]
MTTTLAERFKVAIAEATKIEAMKPVGGRRKINIRQLAKACGVQYPSAHDWTTGKTKSIESENLLAAARFLSVRPDWLAKGVGPMKDAAQAPALALVPQTALSEEEAWLLSAWRDADANGRQLIRMAAAGATKVERHETRQSPG